MREKKKQKHRKASGRHVPGEGEGADRQKRLGGGADRQGAGEGMPTNNGHLSENLSLLFFSPQCFAHGLCILRGTACLPVQLFLTGCTGQRDPVIP